MNGTRGTLSERQQIVGIILAAGLLVGLLWFFAMMPMQANRRKLERANESLLQELTMNKGQFGEKPLERKKDRARAEEERLREEWRRSALRLSAFELMTIHGTQDVSKIDYKVELFNVRERLTRKAAERGIRPSFDLAIDELLLSNEDARKRMLQLKAAEKLMDTAIQIKVGRVEMVEPLEPIVYRDDPELPPYLEEYPVRIQYAGTIENVYGFIQEVFQTNSVFVHRRLKVEKESLQNPSRVRIDATLSAFVFPISPAESMAAPPKAAKPNRARGF